MKILTWMFLLSVPMLVGQVEAQTVTIPIKEQIHVEIAGYLYGPKELPMLMPTDVSIDSKERLYVADGVNNRILIFSAEGKYVESLDAKMGLDLNQPTGLTIDSQDRLWVADTGNHQIVRIALADKSIEIIALPPSDAKHKTDPTDLVLTKDLSRCYVVDNDNHRILVRDNHQGDWKILGKKGRALGQFEYPFMICLGREEYVYVSETLGARIHRMTPRDQWSGIMGTWGVERGQLYRPKGLVADRQGRILVSDSTMQLIQVFGPWGRFEGVLCQPDGQPVHLEHPMGMCFNQKGQLYLVELTANRVVVLNFLDRQVQNPNQKKDHPK